MPDPLFFPLSTLEVDLNKALAKIGKRLYFPKRDDLLKLLKLRLWSERYKVSLDYIVERLVPHYEKLSSRHYVRRNAQTDGIGSPISVLTGHAAEKQLKEFIAKDFPNDEHLAAWREEQQARCIEILYGGRGKEKVKPVLRYKSMDDYVEAYRSSMEYRRTEGFKLEEELAQQPWRGNPFA